jgi:transcriptional regulator
VSQTPELYTKPEWSPRTGTEAFDLIDRTVMGVFVSWTPSGLAVSHLTFLLDRARGEHGTLVSHLARANEHSEFVLQGTRSVAIFRAEHGYISSSWYPAEPTRDSAPTWNFAVVHCHGRPRPTSQEITARHLVELVDRMETGREKRWNVKELGPNGMNRRLPHILGFELPIERLDAKFKMGQDERLRDTRAAIEKLADKIDPQLSAVMERHNEKR